ncbi:hypothetical protein C2845_PM09G10290 [Panicum miliaceum]|uniref:Mitochondrial transcription termination factor family protein n=1 Tax=Panicum miliaceum TaxID=4540 RepID=A0A3L6RYY2_PANMI|nr:hypothetical protein C2845_PM09G10290 [Panicum miliaceum]
MAPPLKPSPEEVSIAWIRNPRRWICMKAVNGRTHGGGRRASCGGGGKGIEGSDGVGTLFPEHEAVKKMTPKSKVLATKVKKTPPKKKVRKGKKVVAFVDKEVVDRRIQLLHNVGFSKDDVLAIVRKQPLVLGLSEQKVRGNVDFLMKDVGLEVSYIVRRPVLLMYSVERRLLPRRCLLKVLREKGLLKGELDYYGTASMGLKVTDLEQQYSGQDPWWWLTTFHNMQVVSNSLSAGYNSLTVQVACYLMFSSERAS